VRLTFPRRVYTQAHCDVTVEAVAAVYARREQIRGMKMIYEPKYLRFFQARFEPVRRFIPRTEVATKHVTQVAAVNGD